MSSLRLKQNLIINGKFYPSGSLDKALIPPKFLTETYVADPQNREGRVLLLRNLSFMSRPKPDSSGVATSYPVHVGAGELFDLAQVPESDRKSLKEGEDFKTDWTLQKLAAMRRRKKTSTLQREQPYDRTGNSKQMSASITTTAKALNGLKLLEACNYDRYLCAALIALQEDNWKEY